MVLRRRVAPLVACLLLAACAIPSTSPAPQVTPIPEVVAPHRGSVLVQYCVGDTESDPVYLGGYPRMYFNDANKLVADSLVQAVVPNSEGLVLYASLISSTTYDASNSLAPFVVPPIANYPALPTPIPTPAQQNPVTYPATATALADQNSANITAYNAAVAQVNAQLVVTKGQVASDVQRLITWSPRIDTGIPSIWGCLQLARQHFAGQPGTKYLIIAGQMTATSDVDFTPDITSTRSLAGVLVHVIFRANCSDAEDCLYWMNYWHGVFIAAGASSVRFDDPTASQAITNLFGGA